MNTYQDQYHRTYHVKTMSSGHIYCLLVFFVALALPFYFSFGDSDFWLKGDTRQMQAIYNNTGFYALQVNSVSGVSSLSEQYSNIPGSSMSALSEASVSFIDKTQSTAVSVSFAGFGSKTITSVNLILYYNVYLVEIEKIINAPLMISQTGNIGTAQIGGVMRYENQKDLFAILDNQKLNLPCFYPNLQSSSTYSQLASYLNSESMCQKLTLSKTVTKTQELIATRTLKYNFAKDQKVEVSYHPTILETLKFRFSTYMGFAIISFVVFKILMLNFIKEGMIQCETRVDLLERV